MRPSRADTRYRTMRPREAASSNDLAGAGQDLLPRSRSRPFLTACFRSLRRSAPAIRSCNMGTATRVSVPARIAQYQREPHTKYKSAASAAPDTIATRRTVLLIVSRRAYVHFEGIVGGQSYSEFRTPATRSVPTPAKLEARGTQPGSQARGDIGSRPYPAAASRKRTSLPCASSHKVRPEARKARASVSGFGAARIGALL